MARDEESRQYYVSLKLTRTRKEPTFGYLLTSLKKFNRKTLYPNFNLQEEN